MLLPNPRPVIALHSPNAHLETGLRTCFQRKAGTVAPSLLGSQFSPVRFVDETLRNTGMLRVFRGKGRSNFSAVQTAWRRERDSNLRVQV